MKYIVDNDLHIHSSLSSCSDDPEQNCERMLQYAKEYFSTTNHSWITFDVSNSRMINTTNKDTNGVYYDYGSLRVIKDSDLPTSIREKAKYNLKKERDANENVLWQCSD